MLIISLISYYVLAVAGFRRPIARTKYGLVRGFEMKTFLGRRIYSFYNVPYTQKMRPMKRFEELRDPRPWEGVLDAGGTPVICPQITHGDKFIGNEDCLILNIYTPMLPNRRFLPDKVLPVIVYIHGGAYSSQSSGAYGPRYLLERDIVFVSINYRLGIPGFGSTGDHMLPGNLGLKDQLMALKWIQKNIIYFGGNKKSVTLLGMSSGSACAQLLSFSKHSQGLFHRLVLIGGSAVEPWAVAKNLLPIMEKISYNLGCPTNSTFDMVSCLERLPIEVLTRGTRSVQINYFPIAPVKPVVDTFTANPILTELPYDSIRFKKADNIPTLMTNVKLEGLFPVAAMWKKERIFEDIDENWLTFAPIVLDLEDVVSDNLMNYTLRQIRKEYFQTMPIKESKMNFLQLITDRKYLENNGKAAALIARYNPHVYYYIFDYLGGRTSVENFTSAESNFGVASHVDDIFYLFNVSNSGKLENNVTDLMMIQRMTTMLYTFASTGVPSVPIVDFLPVRRNTSVYGPLRALIIKSPDIMEMTELENWGNSRFWESLPLTTSTASSIMKKTNGKIPNEN